jgi:hypothetical protein
MHILTHKEILVARLKLPKISRLISAHLFYLALHRRHVSSVYYVKDDWMTEELNMLSLIYMHILTHDYIITLCYIRFNRNFILMLTGAFGCLLETRIGDKIRGPIRPRQ